MLEEHGYEEAHSLVGGFEAWRKANLPVEPK
jgi:rhodanese-related sulfurtransferase